jgi:hypothetical protein
MDARALWPSGEAGSSTTHWGWLAGELGASFPLHRPFLLGIRGVSCVPSFATETHETVAKPAYDDTFVLLSPQPVPPYVFAAATHPYQRDSKESPDIDGDGRGDVGCIRPGRFVLQLALEKPYPVFVLTLPGGYSTVPCFRDTNHDAHYSPEEITRASYATAVLLHTGFDAPAGSEHRSSIACQTCNVADLRLVASHARAFDGKVDYMLVDAADAIALAAKSPFRQAAAQGNIA